MSNFFTWLSTDAPITVVARTIGPPVVVVALVEWIIRAVGGSDL